uniref:C-type lectin domain-containing protein n=1 Tax=Myripristis murdjan TaxID=586833 RepID=A0A667XEB9_9TELE
MVEKSMTWSEAQSYCRQHYTDLATVSSEEDVAKLNDAVGSLISDWSWIGLFRDAWKWSDGSTMSFTKWDNMGYISFIEIFCSCPYSSLVSYSCHSNLAIHCMFHFMFYHLVEERMNWTEAQSYCRQHYTDLATVSSEEDVTKLNDTVGSHPSWIGLYNDINSWRWSLQNKSYYGEGEADLKMWSSGQPHYSEKHCVASHLGKWRSLAIIFCCLVDEKPVFINMT